MFALQQQLQHLRSIYPRARDRDEHADENFADDWREIFAEEYQDMLGNRDVEENYEGLFSGKLVVIEDWPVRELKVGQVGGVATDSEGYLNVFHRADRSWEYRSACRTYCA